MGASSFPASQPCPCGSGRPFRSCCGPFLAGTRSAPTAEKLMRSRYTAYVLRDEPYLRATWHASTRPSDLDLSGDETRWIGLDVRGTERGGPNDEAGTVTFVARYAVGRERHELREVSAFVREDGRWLYVDGVLG